MATIAIPYARDESFYRKMALGLSVFILFGFLQFAARGMVDYKTVPAIFHFHGAVMVGWLGLFSLQPWLVEHDNLALHRKLGWSASVLATLIAPLAIATCIAAIRAKVFPPFFSAPYFLSLVSFGAVMFSATVWAGIALRKRTDWHRRLMLGSAVLLMEPALGRLLPMPLLGGTNGEWLAMVVQLGVLYLVVRHDRISLGRVHPATLTAIGLIVANHVLVDLAARLPLTAELAARVTA